MTKKRKNELKMIKKKAKNDQKIAFFNFCYRDII